MKKVSQFAIVFAAIAVLTFSAASAFGQEYPNKPIRLLVPFSAGGGTDVMARLLGQKLGASLGQAVVIDNKPGADTIIAADILAKSPPDGYTLGIMISEAFSVNPFTHSNLPYDPVKDFAPVSLIGSTAMLLLAKAALPVNTPGELVAYAKANPGKLSYGSGVSSAQFAVEQLRQTTGVSMLYVPYRGAAPAVQALMAGDIDLGIADFFSALPQIKQGKIKAIAVTGTARDPSLPNTPTMIEAGFTMEMGTWWAVHAPAKTPQAVVDRLNREIARIVTMPDYVERIRSMAITPQSSTPAELASRQLSDAARLGPVIKASGIKAQ
jgi:tripartite-type tricarboxylate transporter receptor subunit TctC